MTICLHNITIDILISNKIMHQFQRNKSLITIFCSILNIILQFMQIQGANLPIVTKIEGESDNCP